MLKKTVTVNNVMSLFLRLLVIFTGNLCDKCQNTNHVLEKHISVTKVWHRVGIDLVGQKKKIIIYFSFRASYICSKLLLDTFCRLGWSKIVHFDEFANQLSLIGQYASSAYHPQRLNQNPDHKTEEDG